ncbi:MAG: TolC family protein [Bacteroidetes bacterium]|nr:TolC family protein [Bacteroidota bacterium]
MKSTTGRQAKRLSRLVAALMLTASQLAAQETTVSLTADEALSAALANNRGLKIAALDESAASARYKETEAVFLPQAGLSYTAASTNLPLNAFGFKLQQKTIGSADFDPAHLNHPGGTPNFMTAFEVQQPLINMDQLYQRKGASMQIQIYRLKSLRTREEVVFETRKAYLQLQLSHRELKVMEDALSTAIALYQYTNDRVSQGMLSKADALNVQVQVKNIESRLADAKTQIKNASDYLGFLMGRSPGPVYMTDTAAPQNSAAIPSGAALPENRADLSALRKTIEASELMIRSSKMSALPRLNAFGSYQLNDSRMLGFGAGGYLAGIRLSWDLFKGNSIRSRNATLLVEKNRLTEEYARYKEQSAMELNATRRYLDDAALRIDRQQTAVASAAEAWRILRDRYEQGLSGSTDVLLAQTQLSQQKLALARAIFDRDVTASYVEFLTTSSSEK